MLKYLVILAVLVIANADMSFKQCEIKTGGRFPTEWPLEKPSRENKCFCECALQQMGYIDEHQHFRLKHVATMEAATSNWTFEQEVNWYLPVYNLKDTILWSNDSCQNGFLTFACIRTLPTCIPFPF